MAKRYVLNIDLDGTLTDGSPFWIDRPTPNKTMCRYVRKLYNSCKYVILIHTARQWYDAPLTIAWLIENKIPYHGIMMGKGASDMYIDDKAMLVTSENMDRLLHEEMDEVPMCGKDLHLNGER